MPPQAQDPQPHTAAAAADDADEEESHPDTVAHPFQSPMHSPAKPAAQLDEEESDSEVPELEAVPKKSKSKTELKKKKRPAPEPAPSGKAKKAKKAKAEAGKGKKMVSTKMEKAAPQPTPSRKATKPTTGGKPAEKSAALSSSGLTKSEARRPWSKKDTITILEALAAHVMSEAALMNTADLLATVGDSLDRKDCLCPDMYDKVRSLKNRYEKISSTGNVPTGEDQLRMYHLSEEIWGEKAKEAIAAAAAAAAASQKDSSLTKSKRGQATKEKVMDGNSKGEPVKEVTGQNIDTQKGKKKDQAVVVETTRNVKKKLFMEGTATATQNGDTLVNGNGGKTDNDASTGNQNSGVGTTKETDEDRMQKEIEVISVRRTPRSFDELQNLYPSLAECVERIKAQHPCGVTLRRAFGFIDDEMANALESNIKEQRIVKAKIQIDQWNIKMEVLGLLIHLKEHDF